MASGKERGRRQREDDRPKEDSDGPSEPTEDGVDLVRVECAALWLEGGPAAPSASQVTVHQRVHIEHAHQQRPGHRRGRLRLIGCLP